MVWGALLGAATGGGGGGIGGGQSAESGNEVANDISTGTISVGGVNLGQKAGGIDQSVILAGVAVLGLSVVAFGAFSALKKR